MQAGIFLVLLIFVAIAVVILPVAIFAFLVGRDRRHGPSWRSADGGIFPLDSGESGKAHSHHTSHHHSSHHGSSHGTGGHHGGFDGGGHHGGFDGGFGGGHH